MFIARVTVKSRQLLLERNIIAPHPSFAVMPTFTDPSLSRTRRKSEYRLVALPPVNATSASTLFLDRLESGTPAPSDDNVL